MGELEPLAVLRQGERPAVGERVRRLDSAGFVDALLQFGLGQRRQVEPTGDQLARPDGVVGAADDELGLGRAARGQRHLEA